MKITDVVVRLCHVPLRTPFTSTAVPTTAALTTVLLELVTDDGSRGWGEAAPIRSIGGETAATAKADLAGPLAAVVRNRPVDDLDALLDVVDSALPGRPSAKAAVDIAAHDLAARRLGQPMHFMFGSRTRTVATAVTIALDTPGEMARQARSRASAGFTTFKVKVGDAADVDLRRIRAVRRAAGPHAHLWLDGNQGWDRHTAVRVLRAVEDAGLDVELVEQPVPAGDLAGLAFVRERTGVQVVADEAVLSAADARAVVRHGAADVLNVKLQKNGGIRGTRRLVALAGRSGLACMVGCTLESTISITAAACAIATHPEVPHVDLDAPLWLAEQPVRGGVAVTGPRLALPDRPGLGILGPAHSEE